jgi:O-antigen/teichoic acid export membrane protein
MDHQSTAGGVLHKATKAVKWAVLTEIVSRTAQPIVFIVLAKLLTPDDFGVVGTAMIAIAFCQMFWDAGLSKALVQTKEAHLDAAHVVFWTNLAMGLLIYAILFAGAPLIADFFHSPKSSPVLQVLGLQVIIASLTSVQQALLVRDMGFQRLFWVKLITAFIPGLISIPLAFYGNGVWALVAGTLAGQTINLVLLWKLSSWRPQWKYDTVLARKLFSFGAWVVLESLGAWLMIWGDSVVVGRYLGVHDLGVYRVGVMIVAIIFGVMLNPIVPILFPSLSRLQDDRPALIKFFFRSNRIVMAIALPLGTGLLLTGSETATILFGNKWQGLAQVISILGFAMGISWMYCLNTEILRAIGMAKMTALIMWIHLIIYLPIYWVAVSYGLEAFVITRLGLVFLGMIIHVFFIVKLLGISVFYLWHEGKMVILSVFFMAIVVFTGKAFLCAQMTNGVSCMALFSVVLLGVASYVGTLWILDRQFLLSIKGLIKRATQL